MPESSPEPIASRSIGRYEVRRLLGAGGFARVYLAWDPELDVEVAIKLPKPELAGDVDALERFRREATTAARLRHPNIVTILTVGRLEATFDGVPEGTPYLVMDSLPDSLAARLDAAGTLPESEWLRVGQEVARGLAYAHAHGVVHRDVKPDNVLFGRRGEAVVTDFGIARAVTHRSGGASRSMVLGTPEYFSPEQARGLPLDGRTDVYALGVTLYRTATGVLPFDGDDWYAIMRQHVEVAPEPPQTHVPSISDAAQAIVLRCLEKRPDDRFQSAADLAAALGAASGDASVLPVGADTTVELRPARVTTRRRRSVVGAVGAVAAIGVATAAFLSLRPAPAPVPTSVVRIDSTFPLDTPVVAESTPAVAPATLTPAPVVLTPPLRPPTPTRASGAVAITAPASAAIFVDEGYVGNGTVRVDTLRAGRHVVRATVPSERDCSTSSRETTIDLRRGDERRVTLRPRPCGRLELTVSPQRGAVVTITGDDTNLPNMRLPLERPLILPEGRYRIVIDAPACASYDGIYDVDPSKPPAAKRVALVCS